PRPEGVRRGERQVRPGRAPRGARPVRSSRRAAGSRSARLARGGAVGPARVLGSNGGDAGAYGKQVQVMATGLPQIDVPRHVPEHEGNGPPQGCIVVVVGSVGTVLELVVVVVATVQLPTCASPPSATEPGPGMSAALSTVAFPDAGMQKTLTRRAACGRASS